MPAKESHHTTIIGAGPAGLAVGACLTRAGIQSTILEQSDKLAASWRKHYDRLHLHTDIKNSALPFVPFPKGYPRYPSRDQLVDYLEAYAKKFDLDIRFDQEVTSARYQNDEWNIQTRTALHTSPNLVVATGNARAASIPAWQGLDTFQGKVLHSSQYKNGAAFKGQRVLVVGFGNSGGEIAIDLYEHGAQPAIAVRNPVNVIPRELFGFPVLSIGIVQNSMPAWMADAMNAPILRVVIGDITKLGLRKLPYGPATQIQKDKRIPLIDVGTLKLIRQGHITIYEGVDEFAENRIKFEGGQEAEFDAVILATGFRARVDQFLHGIESAIDKDGTPASTGKESPISGLYFCGYYVSPTGMLREIARKAQKISAAISSNRRPAPSLL